VEQSVFAYMRFADNRSDFSGDRLQFHARPRATGYPHLACRKKATIANCSTATRASTAAAGGRQTWAAFRVTMFPRMFTGKA